MQLMEESKKRNMLVLTNNKYFLVYLYRALEMFREDDQIIISTVSLLSMAEQLIELLVNIRYCDVPTIKDRRNVSIGKDVIATQITLRKRAVNKAV